MRAYILLGILAAVMLPCPVIADDADELAGNGLDALNAGEYDDATEYFLAALEKDKHHAEANTGLLRLYLEVGDYQQAAESADTLAAANAATAEMLALGGDACAAVGKYKKAYELYKKSMALDKGCLHALVGTGRMLALEGKKKESTEILEKAREAYMTGSGHPASEMVHAAAAAIELNRFADANTILGDAIKKDPENLDALVARAGLFLQKYDYPYAKKQFESVLDKNPSHPKALVGLAWTYDYIGELGRERFDKARGFARKALRANRKLIEANLYLAYSELMDGDFKRAESYVGKALKVNGNSIDALGMAAAIHKLRNNKEEYDKTRKHAFETKGKRAEFLYAEAVILQARSLYSEALELGLEILKLDKEYWPAYAIVGLNMLRLGRKKEARDYLKNSHDNDPFNIWTYNSLQLLMHMDDNYKEKKTKEFIIRAHGSEIDTLAPYVEERAAWSCKRLSKKYGVKLDPPTTIELFQKHEFFSARTTGVPGSEATSACFGPVIAMDSPTGLEPGTYNWARTLYCEFVHAFVLKRSRNRIPLWLKEGLSTYEETAAFSHWRGSQERAFVDALDGDSLASLGRLERLFSKPGDAAELALARYHAGLAVEFIAGKFGFDKVLAMIDGYATGKTDGNIFKECLDSSISELDGGFMKWVKERFGKLKIAGRIRASSADRLKDEAELNAASPAAWAKLARAYLAAGKLLDSEAALKKAQKLDPAEPELFLALAELDMHQGFTSSAKERYLKAIEAGLEKPHDVHIILAQLYLGEDKQDEAIEHLNKAAEGFPDDVSAASPYRILYQIYKNKGEEEKANEQLKKIVALTDMDLQARIALADIYLLNNDFSDAAKLLWDVVYMNPLLQGVHERLGDALYGEEDIDGAITEFKRAIVVGGRDVHTAYAGLAQCYFDMENMKLAEENAKKALELNPQNQRARDVLELLGKWSE